MGKNYVRPSMRVISLLTRDIILVSNITDKEVVLDGTDLFDKEEDE